MKFTKISLLVLGSALLSHGAWAQLGADAYHCPLSNEWTWTQIGGGYAAPTWQGTTPYWDAIGVTGTPSQPELTHLQLSPLERASGGWKITCHYHVRNSTHLQIPSTSRTAYFRHCEIRGSNDVYCTNAQ